MSKNETLLDIAIRNYRIALTILRYCADDEGNLNIAGYHLQQATELCIKHYLEINGVRYLHTHSIEDLLDECERSGVAIHCTDTFYDFSPAITKWGSNTRYIKNYRLSLRQIQRGLQLIKDFMCSNGVSEDELSIDKSVNTVHSIDAF